MSESTPDNLSPEEEAIVNQFAQQLDGDGNVIMMVNTRVGPIQMSAEDEEKIRHAARDKTIELIKFTPPSKRVVVAGWIGTITIGAILLLSVSYLAKIIFF